MKSRKKKENNFILKPGVWRLFCVHIKFLRPCLSLLFPFPPYWYTPEKWRSADVFFFYEKHSHTLFLFSPGWILCRERPEKCPWSFFFFFLEIIKNKFFSFVCLFVFFFFYVVSKINIGFVLQMLHNNLYISSPTCTDEVHPFFFFFFFFFFF